MSAGTFNLLDEPWIPVEMTDGSEGLLSMTDVFAMSQQICRLNGEVPTQVFAIMGLLSSVLRRAFDGPRGQDSFVLDDPRLEFHEATAFADWRYWYGHPQEAVEEIAGYLAAFHDRFDVRDPVVPFYQVADLHTAKNGHSELAVILADVPNGDPFFTTRTKEGNERITWAEAARWLIHVQAFDPSGIRSGAVGDPRVKGGKGYPLGPGWGAQIGGLTIERGSLWETLMVNLVPVGVGDLRFEVDRDLPPWERPQLTEREEIEGGREPCGPVDLATWQSRRVCFVGDDDGVTGVVLSQGDRIAPQFRQSLEPRSGWRYSDPQSKKFKTIVYMPREHDPSRALWRGLESILPGTSSYEGRVKGSRISRFCVPAISSWLSQLIDGEALQELTVKYRATGVQLGSNQSVIAEMIDDAIDLPGFLFSEEFAFVRNRVVSAAEIADDLARQFGYFAGNVERAEGADMTDGAEARAREQILAAMGPAFQRWVRQVDLASIDKDMTEWRNRLFDISQDEVGEIVAAAAPAAFEGRMTSRGEMTVGLAEIYFRAARTKLGIVAQEAVEATQTGEGDLNE